jgi:hypothetical protein
MPTLQEHKKRIVSTHGDIKEDKSRYTEIVMNGNLAGTIKIKYMDTIAVEEINEYLRMVIEIPTLLSTNRDLRWWIYQRVSYLMKYDNYLIDEDIEPILAQYFDWLKERDDYVESADDIEERIQRISSRNKIIRPELIETLYHPDRYEKMVASYGEVWADIHLPY